MLRALLLLPLALPAAAHAGSCGIRVNETDAKLVTKPSTTTETAFTVGRWPVKLAVAQTPAEGGGWVFEVVLSRRKDGAWEELLSPKLATGPGLDATLETDSRLGPVKLVCHD